MFYNLQINGKVGVPGDTVTFILVNMFTGETTRESREYPADRYDLPEVAQAWARRKRQELAVRAS